MRALHVAWCVDQRFTMDTSQTGSTPDECPGSGSPNSCSPDLTSSSRSPTSLVKPVDVGLVSVTARLEKRFAITGADSAGVWAPSN